MPVVGIAVERPGSPVASFECGKHIITRKFRVLCDSVLDGPITVVLALGLPKLFDPYVFGAEFHPYCRCRSVEPERMAPASLDWEVTCRYETPEMKDSSAADGGADSNESDGGGTGVENDQQFENPLAAIPEVETHWQTKQIPIYGCQGMGCSVVATNGSTTILTGSTVFFNVGDVVVVYAGSKILTTTITAITPNSNLTLALPWTGPTTAATLVDESFRPLQSSAGEIFVPPPMMDVSELLLTITRNEDINTPVLATSALYQNKVNLDPFFGLNPGQVRCENITCQRQTKQLPDASVFPYLRVTYLFHAKDTWDIQLLDKGSFYRYKTSPSVPGTIIKFKTDDGQPRDGLLDGFGQKLPDASAPVFLTVRPYSWIPFAPLNLPQSFAQVQ